MVAHIEGAGGFDGEGRDLQAFYAAGVRSIGPFWNIANRFGSGVNGSFPVARTLAWTDCVRYRSD